MNKVDELIDARAEHIKKRHTQPHYETLNK